MNTFDVSLYHSINHLALHIHIIDVIMEWIAGYSPELYGILFVVAWFTLPKADSQHRHSLIVACIAGVAALLTNVVISHIWFRPRPFAVLPHGTYHQLIPHGTDSSFPSDHASGSFGFASATWGKSQRWVQRFFTILAVLVLFARVYVGVHWPTDVLAGMVVGTIAGRRMWTCSNMFQPITRAGLRLFKMGSYSQSTARSSSK